jgi:hypothetical protein
MIAFIDQSEQGAPEPESPVINGRRYPLWSQFVARKAEWIGGVLEDLNEAPRIASTKITDIRLEPNGDTSARFLVIGEEFECGGDVHYLGFMGDSEPGWLHIRGYGDSIFRIKKHA